MASIDQPICSMVDSTLLERYVDIDDQKEDKVSQKHIRPWFTVCVEPISHMLLASALSFDPPGPAVIKSLLYQAIRDTTRQQTTDDVITVFDAAEQREETDEISSLVIALEQTKQREVEWDSHHTGRLTYQAYSSNLPHESVRHR